MGHDGRNRETGRPETDFGSFFINCGTTGDTSNRFYKLHEEECCLPSKKTGGCTRRCALSADGWRTIALVSLILGTLCFIPDVHYGLALKGGKGGLAGAKFWSAMSLLLEDVPQVVVSIVFSLAIRINDLPWDDENKMMFGVSLALSAITVLDRLYIIFKCTTTENSGSNVTPH